MQNNQQPIVIGFAKFNLKFTKEIQDQFIQNNSQLPYNQAFSNGKIPINQLRKSNWNLQNYSYHHKQWDNFIGYMDEIECKQFRVNSCKKQFYLYSLFIPTFTNLKILSLSSCGIRNIQGLNLLNADNIEQIDLFWNPITNLKAFSKTKWTRLKAIMFEDDFNILIDVNRVKTNHYLNSIRYKSNLIPFSEDLRFLAKLQASGKLNMCISEEVRDNNLHVIFALRRKYKINEFSI